MASPLGAHSGLLHCLKLWLYSLETLSVRSLSAVHSIESHIPRLPLDLMLHG